ncbi:MAG: DUF4270 family protein [Bacteroidetes bacterium]|nr:DUF4270 family protein [Bacteroidota bacterium]
MRGRFFFLMIVVLFFSCEDPTTLPVSKVFNGNKLQTAYIDTFSVITSTVQLDTVLTNNSGTMLLGRYHDDQLGFVSSSTYFQLGYAGAFRPDIRSKFDSIALILPYNHTYTGDTTNAVNISVYRLTQQMQPRLLPPIVELKTSVFNNGSGFYNSSKVQYNPTPIVSASVKLTPHRDSIYIKMPQAFGANWFSLAQQDSGKLFSSVVNFVTKYFYGLHIDVDPSTNACVVGFKANKMKIRLYYRQLSGDIYKAAHTDFMMVNPGYQFNHIEYDRSGTGLAGTKVLQRVSTESTNNIGFVQTGTGLVTRLDFPSLKSFFSLNNGIVISAAYLDISPIKGSYEKNFLPPSSLNLYATDGSSIPLTNIIGGSANIAYDHEYGVNTYYRYQLFTFIFGQLKSSTGYVTPLILAPVGNQGNGVQRLYLGGRFNSQAKIKLKIYYTYVLN